MKKVDLLIDSMKQLYKQLNLTNVEDIDITELKKLRDFSRDYASNIQELIYGFEEVKQNKV